MAYVYKRVGVTTPQAVFGGPTLFQGAVVKVAMQAADWVSTAGIPVSTTQAGMKTIVAGFGYLTSSTGVTRGCYATWDTSLATPAFILWSGAGVIVVTGGSGTISNDDILVGFLFGES